MSGQHLTIGAVASLTGLTVKALRHYDEIGLLRPDHVEPRTGYRQYSTPQLRTAAAIAALRAVDMPLADVAVALSCPEARRQQLDAHRARLVAQRAGIEACLARITHLQETAMTDVEIRTFPETPIYAVAFTADDNTPVAWPSLPAGGAMLSWGEADDSERITLHFAVEHPATPNDTLGAFEAAVAMTDDPEQVPATVSAVLDWIADHGRDIARPPVERLLPTAPDQAAIELWVPLTPPGDKGLIEPTLRPVPVEMTVNRVAEEQPADAPRTATSARCP